MRGDTESEHAILCWYYCRIKWYCKVNSYKIESYTSFRDINVYNSIFIKLVWIILVNKDQWSVSGFSNKPSNLSLSVILDILWYNKCLYISSLVSLFEFHQGRKKWKPICSQHPYVELIIHQYSEYNLKVFQSGVFWTGKNIIHFKLPFKNSFSLWKFWLIKCWFKAIFIRKYGASNRIQCPLWRVSPLGGPHKS